MGIPAPKEIIQKESVSDRLKNRLWNKTIEINDALKLDENNFYKKLWGDFLGFDLTKIPYWNHIAYSKIQKIVKDTYCNEEWYNIYKLIEFSYECWVDTIYYYYYREEETKIHNIINQVLEQEKSAYRMVSGKFTPITNEQEIQEIETACAISDKYATTKEHLNTAIKLYANRDTPDYSGSITNAVHAVEALAKVILQDEKSTFSKLMAKLNTQYNLPESLKLAFNNLYGYASNENGARHVLKDGQTKATESEARFILVTCSAMINFLIENFGE